MDQPSRDDLAELAVARGFCTREAIEDALRALDEAVAGGGEAHLGQILLRKGLLTSSDLSTLLLELQGASTDGLHTARTLPSAGHSNDRTLSASHATPPSTIGPYSILDTIGHGAMGVVYRARHETSGETVALKVLQLPPGQNADERVERFLREARIVANLDHPNIIRIRDSGEAGGLHYCAMELIDGQPLDTILETQPPSQKRSLQMVEDVARALHYAHQEGVIHRDIKPSNLLVGADRVIRILDFGLARAEGDEDRSLTRTGKPMGTPYYMSPEQVRGRRRTIDHRTDIYSLGAVLYELIAGRRPFLGRSTSDLYHAILHDEPTPLHRLNPSTPIALDHICRRAMAREIDDRYGSALDLAADIRRFLQGRTLNIRSTRRLRRKATGRLQPLHAALAIGGLLLIASAILHFALQTTGDAARQPDPASWQTALDDYESAIRNRNYGAAALGLDRLRTDGAPDDVLLRAREMAGDKILIHFTETVTAGDLSGAAGLLESGRRLGLSDDSLERMRDLGRSQARDSIRDLLEKGLENEAALLVDSVREAFGEDELLAELGRWASGLAPLHLTTVPPGLPVSLHRYDPDSGSPIGERETIGTTPIAALPVRTGHHILQIDRPDGDPIRFPIALERAPDGQPQRVDIDLDLSTIPGDMMLVPAGETLLGPPTGERRVDLPGFLIDRTEVTGDAYARFLASRPDEHDQARLLPYFPFQDPAAYDSIWTGPTPPPGLGQTPIHFIGHEEALRYAIAAGKRLPSMRQWEKAARGIDGRPFPWGRRFDPNRALLLRPGARGPLPVGSFPDGSSPYGVLDLCGNVAEWTATRLDDGWIVVLGGGFATDPATGEAFQVGRIASNLASPLVGFRCLRAYLTERSPTDLFEILDDPDPARRQEAARRLGAEPTSRDIGRRLVRRVLEETDEAARWTAIESLRRHDPTAATADLLDAAAQGDAARARRALEGAAALAEPDAIEPILAHLETGDEALQIALVKVLTRRHLADALPAYRRLFDRSEQDAVRSRAALLIASLGDSDGLRFLRRAVEKGPAEIRHATAIYLWWLGDPAGLIPLLEIHFQGTRLFTDVRLIVCRFLRDDRALPTLRTRGLLHENEMIRVACLEMLGVKRDGAALEAIARLTDEDPSERVRKTAAIAAGRIRDE